jgi:hypothetical protein
VLIKPKVKTVRDCKPFFQRLFLTILMVVSVHILSGDLILHKRTMGPIKTLVYGLRRYDVDRCAALIEGGGSTRNVVGFMSHKSNIYLVRKAAIKSTGC